jgi:flagellar motor switch protein FliG
VVEVPPARQPEKVSGARKAAILCLTLGEEVAAEVFKYLDEAEVQKVSKELALLRDVPVETSDNVMQEFQQMLLVRSYVSMGGVDYAKRLLVKSFGAESAKRMLDKVLHAIESPVLFEALQKVDPPQLAKLFQAEHPQTIAAVLAHLDASIAAQTIHNLPESQRSEIALRMASLQTVSQDVIRRIAAMMDQKLASIANLQRTTVGGVRAVADICNRLDRDLQSQMLEEIEVSDPTLAVEIRNLMLTFEDIMLLDDIGIREILQLVDKKVLALALKGTMVKLQERFFSNMSQRAVEMMKEEMDFMGQVKMRDVTAAQREIVEIMRQLEDQGVINISGGGAKEDEYVS